MFVTSGEASQPSLASRNGEHLPSVSGLIRLLASRCRQHLPSVSSLIGLALDGCRWKETPRGQASKKQASWAQCLLAQSHQLSHLTVLHLYAAVRIDQMPEG